MLSIYYVLNLFILLICYPIISAQLKDIRENVPVLEAPTDIQGEENVGSEPVSYTHLTLPTNREV